MKLKLCWLLLSVFLTQTICLSQNWDLARCQKIENHVLEKGTKTDDGKYRFLTSADEIITVIPISHAIELEVPDMKITIFWKEDQGFKGNTLNNQHIVDWSKKSAYISKTEEYITSYADYPPEPMYGVLDPHSVDMLSMLTKSLVNTIITHGEEDVLDTLNKDKFVLWVDNAEFIVYQTETKLKVTMNIDGVHSCSLFWILDRPAKEGKMGYCHSCDDTVPIEKKLLFELNAKLSEVGI